MSVDLSRIGPLADALARYDPNAHDVEWAQQFVRAVIGMGFRPPAREMQPGDLIIHVESMFGRDTGKGMVRLLWGDLEATLSPEEAFKHAVRVAAVAGAAEADEGFVRWMRERMGISEEGVIAALRELREMRG